MPVAEPVSPVVLCFGGIPVLGGVVALLDALRLNRKSSGGGGCKSGCCTSILSCLGSCCSSLCTSSCCAGRAGAPPPAAKKTKAGALDGYGANVFKGVVAAPYLERNGLTLADLESGSWVKDPSKADKMAKAVLQFGLDRGASSFCHTFQPLASTFRHGQVGQVQNAMWEFGSDGKPKWDFKGKDLLRGETDGSSYPNGGLRATHTAGGYLTVDPESPIWVKDDCIHAPSCFVSFEGNALDEKTPLKRAVQAMSQQGKRLFRLLGCDIDGMMVNIGLEQEFFFVPRDQYYRRPDLQFCGRTVMGRMPGRGQELCDHYMAPISLSSQHPAMACMKEMQEECYKIGIPLRTRHREVAPNQYEFAPLFGPVAEHTDENLKVMQIMTEVAGKHGLACLLQEKPFQGINGSGKHNNWSISAVKSGKQTNLYHPGQLTKLSGRAEMFPIVMACTVSAVDKFGDLMRAAIACPGNDFRLGAMEAPPAVLSTYLGQQLTDYLKAFIQGEAGEYKPREKKIELGVSALPSITAPAEDRNRTSPFPYGGYRFEFRAVGSSQNVSLVNTVLAAMMANEFRELAERVEAGYSAISVAQVMLKQHFKCVYNGNGYDPQWPDKAVAQGVCRIDSGVEAICRLTEPKNVDLFVKAGVFTADEVVARRNVLLELYTGTVEMEALTMVDMIHQHVIPSCRNAGLQSSGIETGVRRIEEAIKAIHAAHDEEQSAKLSRVLRLELMAEVRSLCDEAEGKCPPHLWTMATYKDLLFLDIAPNVNLDTQTFRP